MKITSYQLHHNIAQRVKIKFNFDKKIKPVKALRGVGGEKTVKPPTSSGSEMNCGSEHKCSKEFYKQKKKTLVRVLELYYNNKKRTYCSKNDD